MILITINYYNFLLIETLTINVKTMAIGFHSFSPTMAVKSSCQLSSKKSSRVQQGANIDF